MTIPPSLHLAITLKAKLRVAPLVTDVCPGLNVHLEMGFGHLIPVFAQVMGVEELYEFIKRCKTRHVQRRILF